MPSCWACLEARLRALLSMTAKKESKKMPFKEKSQITSEIGHSHPVNNAIALLRRLKSSVQGHFQLRQRRFSISSSSGFFRSNFYGEKCFGGTGTFWNMRISRWSIRLVAFGHGAPKENFVQWNPGSVGRRVIKTRRWKLRTLTKPSVRS